MKKLLAMLIVLLSCDGIINAVYTGVTDWSNLTQEQKEAKALEIRRAVEAERQLVKQEAQQYKALAQTIRHLLDQDFIKQAIKDTLAKFLAQNPIDSIQRNQAIGLINLIINSSKAEREWTQGRRQREAQANYAQMTPEQQDVWVDNDRKEINAIQEQSQGKFARFAQAFSNTMPGTKSDQFMTDLFESIGQAIIEVLQQSQSTSDSKH